jgi:hypothetical protein
MCGYPVLPPRGASATGRVDPTSCIRQIRSLYYNLENLILLAVDCVAGPTRALLLKVGSTLAYSVPNAAYRIGIMKAG